MRQSFCARVVAHEWRLPLLKLEPGAPFDRYVGETERNFRRAVRPAETMAPAVLWLDELEKAFAAGGDGGVDGSLSGRLLESFLSWLQKRREGVFVVATANDVAACSPELVRKGRFDETFFVGAGRGGAAGDLGATPRQASAEPGGVPPGRARGDGRL